MYIITKLLSVAIPAMNLQNAKAITLVAKTVDPLPIMAIRLEITNTGSRPMRSAHTPKPKEPITDPMKNKDCPSVDFHAESQTQLSCFVKRVIKERNK